MCLAQKSLLLAAAIGALSLLAGPVIADWDEGDGHKMHWPQLPDPTGWDVKFASPNVLADDWQCSASGPVSDIHFWFSAQGDQPFVVDQIHASIHADIPALPGSYSKPANPALWEQNFLPERFSTRLYGTGDQGWYDPYAGFVESDHEMIWQANITGIQDPFHQVEGTIYWLDLSVTAHNLETGLLVPLGWKTSMSPHFMDDATWTEVVIGGEVFWNELRDPLTGESLDLAFVITPEPGTLVLLVTAGIGLLLFAWRRRSDVFVR